MSKRPPKRRYKLFRCVLGGTVGGCVYTQTKTKAAKLLGTSLWHLNKYGSEVPDPILTEEVQRVIQEPDTPFFYSREGYRVPYFKTIDEVARYISGI